MDILPPPRRPKPVVAHTLPKPELPTPPPVKPVARPQAKSKPFAFKRPFYRRWQFWVLSSLSFIVVCGLGTVGWYFWSLQPKDASATSQTHILVKSGDTSQVIIDKLAEAGVIRSKLATRLYVEMAGIKNHLQAGGYVLSARQSVGDIMSHIAAGKSDEQMVTILPGRTLKELREDLKKYGYTDEDITAAFNATYKSPLLADKPAGVSLEGYIFPESFRVSVADPLSDLFERSFDELYGRLQQDGMIDKFRAHGLNLHQALTLASIVQKEVSDVNEQRQVAQVFYSRLAAGMVLGSDVTFEYAAALLGVTPAVDIDSPYNTRINPGLPPGPIANMNYAALQAVADPAPGDFLYFVAGDDGKTYYAHTTEEHQANIAAHCHDLCS